MAVIQIQKSNIGGVVAGEVNRIVAIEPFKDIGEGVDIVV